jgi:tRNA (cmo5U34)-methyltransferase
MLHLAEREDRLHTVAEVHRRMRPGAPFVVMHVSYPQGDDAERQLWLDRHGGYLLASGNDPTYVEKASTMLCEDMPALSPDEDRATWSRPGSRVYSVLLCVHVPRLVGYA